MRKVTTVTEVRKSGRGYYQTESIVPFVRLRGRWLEKYGFKPGVKVYIHEGVDGLTLSAAPPMQVSELVPLEEIKAKYKALGIETEVRTKKRKASATPSPAERGEPFAVPTCGIANTDPLDMTADDFDVWLKCIPSADVRADWIARREKVKRYEKPHIPGKAEQLAFTFGEEEPIPLEHFIPTKIGARAYAKILKEY